MLIIGLNSTSANIILNMLPRETLLKGVENRTEITRIVDQAEIAVKTWEVVVSDFFSPPVIAEAVSYTHLTLPTKA